MKIWNIPHLRFEGMLYLSNRRILNFVSAMMLPQITVVWPHNKQPVPLVVCLGSESCHEKFNWVNHQVRSQTALWDQLPTRHLVQDPVSRWHCSGFQVVDLRLICGRYNFLKLWFLASVPSADLWSRCESDVPCGHQLNDHMLRGQCYSFRSFAFWFILSVNMAQTSASYRRR